MTVNKWGHKMTDQEISYGLQLDELEYAKYRKNPQQYLRESDRNMQMEMIDSIDEDIKKWQAQTDAILGGGNHG